MIERSNWLDSQKMDESMESQDGIVHSWLYCVDDYESLQNDLLIAANMGSLLLEENSSLKEVYYIFLKQVRK